MSYEAKVCRAYLDVAEVTKNSLITAVLSSNESLNLSPEQVKKLVAILTRSHDLSVSAGLNALQRVASTDISRDAVGASIERGDKEADGKKKSKSTKSEAA